MTTPGKPRGAVTHHYGNFGAMPKHTEPTMPTCEYRPGPARICGKPATDAVDDGTGRLVFVCDKHSAAVSAPRPAKPSFCGLNSAASDPTAKHVRSPYVFGPIEHRRPRGKN